MTTLEWIASIWITGIVFNGIIAIKYLIHRGNISPIEIIIYTINCLLWTWMTALFIICFAINDWWEQNKYSLKRAKWCLK